MDVSTVIGMVLSSTVIGALISGAFTRVSEKESNDINLLDRAYKEIERLDDQVAERDRIIAEKDIIIERLKKERSM
ncbi:hypothetical protein [Alkalibacterium thalassium]|uniref:Uncharacterized protein n=1 Tax=Alkalibacterium thalassium TaxID=426701 RepID=A0A1G8VNK1_9LACT|nr:hypothetical protein [Alkalibacterium thalassium]SDJ67572.1 hypothetical protein SAMN04488098_100240 [Alkalibacterium thalassium]